MVIRTALIMLATVFALSTPAQESKPQDQRGRDREGNALPERAIGRLGSTHWQISPFSSLRYTSDGKALLAFSPNQPTSTAFSRKTTIQTLNAVDGNTLSRHDASLSPAVTAWRELSGKGSGIHPATWSLSPDGRLLAFCGETTSGSTQIRIRQAGAEKDVFELSDETNRFTYIRFSPDGRRIAAIQTRLMESTERDNGPPVLISMWDVTSRKRMAQFAEGSARNSFKPLLFSFSPDGRWLVATGSNDKKSDILRIWDVKENKGPSQFEGHKATLGSIAFSPDGKLLAEVSDGKLRLWNPATGKLVRTMGGSLRACEGIVFSPTGKYLAVSDGTKMTLWDIEAARELRSFDDVHGIQFSPDGLTVALAMKEGTIRLVAMVSGKTLLEQEDDLHLPSFNECFHAAEQGAGWPIAFSPDGAVFAASSPSGSAVAHRDSEHDVFPCRFVRWQDARRRWS
jgi:WD40 repeat protein